MPSDEKTNALVGSWSAVITAVDQGVTFPGLLSFTSDGFVLADEVPAAFETSGHGSWVEMGPLGAAYIFGFVWKQRKQGFGSRKGEWNPAI